jgi:hypothetical protein
MELIKTFSAGEYIEALDSWSWVDLAGKTPLFASLFGDVFFESADGCWLLDVVSGAFERTWPTVDELRAALGSEAGRDLYLLEPLAAAALESGIRLGRSHVFDFAVPPVLGGPQEVENLEAADFIVAVNIAGQIHGQVRDLPPGTPVGEIKIKQP